MTRFPFTAIRGQEAMQTALLAAAIDPTIGGVLLRGQKGTAKSTAARALAGLLPQIEVVRDCPFLCAPDDKRAIHAECRELHVQGTVPESHMRPTPFVELPLSATEDRLVGTLHLEKTLVSGERHFEPGLLAQAHRGILYVDEVNLLPDHLVDLLLDVAASGLNQVERDGVCFSHASRFILIGSMNPEEGELRPQFLDRFGLCVTIQGVEDPALRRRLVRDRLAFEQDPEAFLHSVVTEEERLRSQILVARQRLGDVVVPDSAIDRAVQLASAAMAQGHRAELVMTRTARAIAAFCERNQVGDAELAEAARHVLPHRIVSRPGETAAQTAERIDRLLADLEIGQGIVTPDEGGETSADALLDLDDIDFPGSAAAGSMLFTYLKKKSKTATSTLTSPST